jgi:glucose/arabinose dehydrogenase
VRTLVLISALVLALAAGGPVPALVPTVPDMPVSAPVDGAPQVLLAPVPGVFRLPVAVAQHPDSADLYVVEKTGHVRAVRDGVLFDPVAVLDLSAETSAIGLEQGLLGLAFAPDGEHLYVNLTDDDGHTHVLEFAVTDGHADPATRREVLFVEQPLANHNGGSVLFGPDGFLYVGLGDGGGAGDPEYTGQSTDSLLGKLLRIDPRLGPDGEPYTIPDDNPFVSDEEDEEVGAQADPDARPEIWAYGLRNPWKFSFDRASGDLWIADVGQNRWEEINVARADSTGGENYGWNHMEGFELYAGRPDGAEEPEDHHRPLHVYANGGGRCSITGGHVYRGEAIEWLQGAYVYGDWCEGLIRWLREEDGVVVAEGDLGVNVPLLTSFGEDHDGELYAVSMLGAVLKLLPLPL